MGLTLGVPEYAWHPVDDHGDPIPYSAFDPRVYFEIETKKGDPLGKVVLRLSKAHHRLTSNFINLCEGKTYGKRSYRGTPLHAVLRSEGIILGGDVDLFNGHGGRAANGEFCFADNAPSLPAERGSLCMLNHSHKSLYFDSQFFILTKRPEALEDGVCFGYVEEGIEVLDRVVQKYGTGSGQPIEDVIIIDSGIF